MTYCTLPSHFIPPQYLCRASEAQKILSVNDRPVECTASRIAIAEITQILFFAVQTTIYALAYAGVIPPLAAGLVSIVLIPVEALAAYNTFVHFKPCSRALMTAAAVFMLTVCAGFACMGIIADSAITLCVGGILLHVARNISECVDSSNARKNPLYLQQVLNRNSVPEPTDA